MKIFKYVFKWLGSILHISLIVSDKKEADNLIKKVYQISSDFEKKYSRFIPNSLLSILNNEKKLKIDQDFLWLLIKSKEIYDFTNWFFNPLVNLSNIWYWKSWEINNFDFEKNKENLDFNKIWIFWDTVVLQDGMNLDFGAIGKWYLSDLIAKFLKLNNVNNFLVNVGGDIYVSGKNQNWKNWIVSVPNWLQNNKLINFSLTNCSLSSSWINIRKRKNNNWNKFHHIKTPWEKNQKFDIITISVLDKFAYKTDSLSTSILSMWFDLWKEFCEKNNIKSYFVLSNWKIWHNMN